MLDCDVIKHEPYIELITTYAGCSMHIFVVPFASGNILAIPTHGISVEIAGLNNDTYTLDALNQIGFSPVLSRHVAAILTGYSKSKK